MVAEEMHFGRAAERLGIAQPQLSVWIRRLEADLGVELFDRSARTIRLTDAGAAVREPVLRTLREADLVHRAAAHGASGVVGKVSIGYAGASSREILPQMAGALRAAQPGIELNFVSMVYGGHAQQQVAAGILDVGFSRLPVKNGEVATRIFTYERMLAALPAGHRLAGQPRVDIRDLAEEPFVNFPATGGSTVRDLTLRLALEAGFSPRVVQEAPDSYAILGLVAAGVGVALTVSSVQHINTPGLVYRELTGAPTYVAACLAWRKSGTSRATEAVLRVMEDVLPTPEPPEGRILQ